MISEVVTASNPNTVVKRVVIPAPTSRQATAMKPTGNPVRENQPRTPLNVPNSQQNVQRELELARRIRMQAQRYLQETEMKARSEAQRLILQTRLEIRKEIQEMVNRASEEIQSVLSDIRVIRITAQEELAAQKKYTDAAKLRSFTLSLQEEEQEPEEKPKKKKPAKKAALVK